MIAMRLLRGPAASAEAQALTIACRMLGCLAAPQCHEAGDWTTSSVPTVISRRWMATGLHVSGSDGRQLNATSANINAGQGDMHASIFPTAEGAEDQDEAGEDTAFYEDPDTQKLRQQLLQTALTFVVS